MRRMGLKHEGKRCILLMRGTVLNLKLLSIQLIQFGSLLAFWLANKRALDTLLKAASHKSRVVAKKKKSLRHMKPMELQIASQVSHN